MPLPAPPPLRPVLVDWAEPPVQRGSCRHCPSLQFFFSFLFFFSPDLNHFSTLHKGQTYLKSLGIIPLPLVQRSLSIVYGFLLFRLLLLTPLPLNLLPIVPVSHLHCHLLHLFFCYSSDYFHPFYFFILITLSSFTNFYLPILSALSPFVHQSFYQSFSDILAFLQPFARST